MYDYWHFLEPHFGQVFLVPQWRPAESRATWTWEQPGGSPHPTSDALAELRRLLEAAADSVPERLRVDQPSGHTPAAAPASIRDAVIGRGFAIVRSLSTKTDEQLSQFAGRTRVGLRIHSWGSAVAAHPFSFDTPKQEIRGRVVIEGVRRPSGEIALEDWRGVPLERVRPEDDGTFVFSAVAAGLYKVHARFEGVSLEVPEVSVNVSEDESSEVNFHGTRGRNAAGPAPPERSREPVRPARGKSPIAVFVLPAFLLLAGLWFAYRQWGKEGATSANGYDRWRVTSAGKGEGGDQTNAGRAGAASGVVAGPVAEVRKSERDAADRSGNQGSGDAGTDKRSPNADNPGAADGLGPTDFGSKPDPAESAGAPASVGPKAAAGNDAEVGPTETKAPTGAAAAAKAPEVASEIPAASGDFSGPRPERSVAGKTPTSASESTGPGGNPPSDSEGENAAVSGSTSTGGASQSSTSGAPSGAQSPASKALAASAGAIPSSGHGSASSTGQSAAKSNAGAGNSGGRSPIAGSEARSGARAQEASAAVSSAAADKDDAAPSVSKGAQAPDPTGQSETSRSAAPSLVQNSDSHPPANADARPPVSAEHKAVRRVIASASGTAASGDPSGSASGGEFAGGIDRLGGTTDPRIGDPAETVAERKWILEPMGDAQSSAQSIPRTLLFPHFVSGFAVDFESAPGAAQPVWRYPSGKEAFEGVVSAGHAELSWSDFAAASETDCSLVNSDGRAIARVVAGRRGEVTLFVAGSARGWYWVGIESAPEDERVAPASDRAGRFDWKRPDGGPLPPGWRRDDGWLGGRGHRLDMPLRADRPENFNIEVAFVDQLTGWMLVGAPERRLHNY